MRQRVTAIDYDGLVQQHRVHADCYIDPEIYEDELERIFYRGWVYVGHESEVPDPGDWKQAWIGRLSVLLIRGDDRKVRVLMNRCAHRAATLCQSDRGSYRLRPEGKEFRIAHKKVELVANDEVIDNLTFLV